MLMLPTTGVTERLPAINLNINISAARGQFSECGRSAEAEGRAHVAAGDIG
jgi:hypothetical protein